MRIRFVKRAQELGLTLAETEGLLAVGLDGEGGTCGDVKSQALSKLADVEARLRDLTAIRDALRALAESCPCTGPTSACPILDALHQQEGTSGSPSTR